MDSEVVTFLSGAATGIGAFWLLFFFGKVGNRTQLSVTPTPETVNDKTLPEYDDPICHKTCYNHFIDIEVMLKDGEIIKTHRNYGTDQITCTDRSKHSCRVVVVEGVRKYKRTKDWDFYDAERHFYSLLPKLDRRNDVWTYIDDSGVSHTIRTEDIEKFSYTTSKEVVTNV